MTYFGRLKHKSNPAECSIESLSRTFIKIQTVKLLVQRYIYAEIVRPRRQGEPLKHSR